MPIYPQKNLRRVGQAKYIKPYMLKGLNIVHPNKLWAIDITYDIKVRQDGKGRVIDTIFIEKLWRSVKYYSVYIKVPSDRLQFYKGLKEYFDYSNNEFCHQG